jgi:hypothetical protein
MNKKINLSNNKKRIQEEAPQQEQWLRFLAGCRAMGRSKLKVIVVGVYSLLMGCLWVFRAHILRLIPLPDIDATLSSALLVLYRLSLQFIQPALAALILITIIIGYGNPKGTKKIRDKLFEMGLYNSTERSPLLTARYSYKENPNIVIYEFEPFGIPESKWDLKEIGKAIRRDIKKLEERKGRYLLYTTPLCSNFNINTNDDEF